MGAGRQLLPQMGGVPVSARDVQQKRKRAPKASVACDTCRRLKSKCDQNMPCNVCEAKFEECVYRCKQPSKYARISSPVQDLNISLPANHLEPAPPAPVPTRPAAPQAVNVAQPITSSERRISASDSRSFVPASTLESGNIDPPQPTDDTSSEDETSPQGFGQTNSRTKGVEFYGPAATLAFLIELRTRIAAFRRNLRSTKLRKGRDRAQSRSTLVNLMDGEEVDLADSGANHSQNGVAIESPESHRQSSSPNYQWVAPFTVSNREVEKQCIDLYFSNLHCIYYFLNKASFMARCANEIWIDSESGGERSGSKFPAVYNAVVAVGALTAGQSLVAGSGTASTTAFWEQLLKYCNEHASVLVKESQAPRELAKIYFARAKTLLGDFFEACSLESQQALFLMSIFCVYALKPHSSYMYHGMAVRTAMAIGASNLPNTGKNTIEGIRTWWLMYYHEMELCSLLGRETCLQDAEHYPVFLARFGEAFPPQIGSSQDENLFFSRCNTELARILKNISEQIYHTGSIVSNNARELSDRQKAALELHERLQRWKKSLKPVFDLDFASIVEDEVVTKRKIILQLRLSSAQIMIHRPFLVSAANQPSKTGNYSEHVQMCLTAARDMIQHLYDTFKYRPFFRTWWYATSYAFNASSIVLYSLVTGQHDVDSSLLLADVEKALNIFQAMEGITVASRCARLIREMLHVAELAARNQDSMHGAAQGQTQTQPYEENVANSTIPLKSSALPNPVDNGSVNSGFDALAFPTDDDFFRNMMDVTLLDSFGANRPNGIDFSLDLDLGLNDYGIEQFYGNFNSSQI